MATNYTENYKLPLWEPDDKFTRTEFNETHQKLDDALKGQADTLGEHTAALAKCGNCRIEHRTYTGDGKYGEENAIRMTFGRTPMLVAVIDPRGNFAIMVYASQEALRNPNSQMRTMVRWTEDGVYWFCASNSWEHFNDANAVYHVVAFLPMD